MEDEEAVSRSTPAFRLKWDVFLSFRGEDTRDGFTDRLYTELYRSGVRVFRDDDGMTQGDEINSSLLEAIEDSAASITIISPKYASSRWCLEELAKICECRRLILPVFYLVDPSNVRQQKGPFEDDFRSHEERFGEDAVMRWRKAMKKAGGISGHVFQNKGEQQLIRSLVQRVLTELSNTPLVVAPYIVGLSFRIEELMKLLDVKFSGIQVLGFHGMGGVGKTTLAKVLFNKLVSQFEHRSFISNVRETYAKQNGLVSLQNELISDISQGNVPPVNDLNDGKLAIERILHEKPILVVLDDVDDVSQLTALARREWFCQGSRIIITTRDREVLPTHLVNEIYEIRELGSSDSLKLFSYHAFRREKPIETYLNFSQQIVSLTGGLPLALEVFGSFLFDKRRVEEWVDALQKLKQIRPRHLRDVLKISFDGLDEPEKCIFLDIACLLVNLRIKRDDAIDIMKGCGFSAEIAINVLVGKSLIKVTEDNTLWMHDQIRDMGREIVRHDIVDLDTRSRLWDHNEILSVFKNGTRARSTEGIILDFEKPDISWDPSAKTISWNKLLEAPNFTSVVAYLKEKYREYFFHGAKNDGYVTLSTKPFESMVKLRLLQLSHVKLEGNFKHIPAQLRWLQWKKCPLENLPPNFCPRGLTVLDLSESKIKRVWGWRRCYWYHNKVAENLMVLNLHGCYNITTIPNLSGHPALEKLILERCSSLTRIHKSIGDASRLRHLNLKDCSNLVEFPSDISGLKHLENLILSGCSKLKELPQDMGSMKSLRELLLDSTAIDKLPESIFHLTKLEMLSLNNCQSLQQLPTHLGLLGSLRELSLNGSALEELPYSIGSLKNLKKLSLMRCKSLTAIPDSVGKLELLTEFLLNYSSVRELPASVGSIYYLKVLSVGNCCSISSLPVCIEELASLVELQLDGTSIKNLPDQVGALKSLEKLAMRNCKVLRSLPESIGNLLTLTTLTIENAAISELPESIGMLENLIMLRLNKCDQLCRLPASMGKLKSLHHLLMEGTAVTELPENFGLLSSLMILKMGKKPYHEAKGFVLPSSFSRLSMLKELDAHGWKISGRIPDDFEKLSSLEILNIGHNDFCSLPSSLKGLSILKKLLLPHCKELKVLPPLPSSLEEVNAANCTALESIYDISNLKSLQELHLTNCEKLVDIPGFESLKALRRLHVGGCNLCSSIVKGKLDKVALRNFYSLSIPGSEIPDWFTQEVVCFRERKNHVIKSVIICVVTSIDYQIPDDLRDQLPVIPTIQAQIFRLTKPVFTTAMRVPKTHEDQVYLRRFPNFHALVSILKDGDEIRVAMRDPPYVKGVELKKCGICLVFESDDDYDGNEESLDASQQSVSEKLTKFVRSSRS